MKEITTGNRESKNDIYERKSVQKRQLRRFTGIVVHLQLTLGEIVNQNCALIIHRDCAVQDFLG